MTLGEIYDAIQARANANQISGRISPLQYRLLLIEASTIILNRQLKNMEETQEVNDDLYPFVKTFGEAGENSITSIGSGLFDIPEDYVRYVVSQRRIPVPQGCGNKADIQKKRITIFPPSKFHNRVASYLYKPTLNRPIMTFENNKIHVSPESISVITFSYIRRPLQPFYDFNISGGVPIYLPPGSVHDGSNPEVPAGTPSRSVELEWREEMHHEFIEVLSFLIGIPTQNAVLLQTSRPEKT